MYLEPVPYRYLTKTLLITSLLIYFIINHNETSRKKVIMVVAALGCFIIGDLFLITMESKPLFIWGVFFFAIAKVLYSVRFSNHSDFKIYQLLPFLLFCFAYMCSVMLLVYDNLEDYFLPTLGYLFIVLIVAQFAYLRRNEVNKTSYWLVLIGIMFSMFSDSITLLKEFYSPNIAYHQITIMLFYGLSQYFIIVGIIQENNETIKTTRITNN
ncbi:lysoplasmalogenase [Lacinutrix neustonica]|uniref:Lysoplasmalogenase n=1 Tax=Lacinutrix neustonica TaxID=2980107 RepID=A0A9E8MZW3_9FLAO|nr:lysoplasmalogenase [Lacinutrix neustonica]WAC03925.1 lysoplasmalogenase [Lacinutrix neustonica]